MLETILEAVCRCIAEQGIQAVRAWNAEQLQEGAVVAVGLAGGSLFSPGAGNYLGMSRDALTGVEVERFGWRAELTLALDCYAPVDGKDCLSVFAGAVQALQKLGGGLKLRQVDCGEIGYDKASRRYHCRGKLRGTAFLIGEQPEDGEEIRHFILKGVAGLGE